MIYNNFAYYKTSFPQYAAEQVSRISRQYTLVSSYHASGSQWHQKYHDFDDWQWTRLGQKKIDNDDGILKTMLEFPFQFKLDSIITEKYG